MMTKCLRLAACLIVSAALNTSFAENPKSVVAKKEPETLRDSLKAVINSGAELFNKYGDHAGCYRVYQGALISLKPLLAASMQKKVRDSLVEAEDLPRYSDRAFALRKVIDEVRGQTSPAK